jgi:uncharacterized RDD family membrane protein YckC
MSTGAYYAQTDRATGPRSGFWRRFGAVFIDGILLGLVTGILVEILKGGGYALGFIVAISYYTYFEGGPKGQTLGKRALGIRVIDFDSGGSIGYSRAAIRYVTSIVSALIIYIGYLWMLWDREKQCWHDKTANSVVVPESAYPVR